MSFYAYIHVRPGADANGAFYVGKGHGRRSHDFQRRNLHHQRIINKYGASLSKIDPKDYDAFETDIKALSAGTSPEDGY